MADVDGTLSPGEPGAPTDPALPGGLPEDKQSPQDDVEALELESPEGEAGEPSPTRRGVGKRIDELTREKYEARRERDHWRELALRQPQQVAAPPAQAPTAPQGTAKPTLEAFNYDQEAYTAALVQHEAQRLIAEQRQAEQQTRQQQEAQAARANFAEKSAKIAELHADFHEVVTNPALPVNQVMFDTILSLDDGPAVAYYLGTHPAEAAKIAGLQPYAAAAALGRLEAKLASAKPSTTTRAPAPVSTIAGNANPSVTKSLEDMTPDEFSRYRNQQIYGSRLNKQNGGVRR